MKKIIAMLLVFLIVLLTSCGAFGGMKEYKLNFADLNWSDSQYPSLIEPIAVEYSSNTSFFIYFYFPDISIYSSDYPNLSRVVFVISPTYTTTCPTNYISSCSEFLSRATQGSTISFGTIMNGGYIKTTIYTTRPYGDYTYRLRDLDIYFDDSIFFGPINTTQRTALANAIDLIIENTVVLFSTKEYSDSAIPKAFN